MSEGPFIAPSAQVGDVARVEDRAMLLDQAAVAGDGVLKDGAVARDHATVYGIMSGRSMASQSAFIGPRADIRDLTSVYGMAHVNSAVVCGSSLVGDSAAINGAGYPEDVWIESANILGTFVVTGSAHIIGGSYSAGNVGPNAELRGSAHVINVQTAGFDVTVWRSKTEAMVTVGCQRFPLKSSPGMIRELAREHDHPLPARWEDLRTFLIAQTAWWY